jgi:outer membrane cobalamin receptor
MRTYLIIASLLLAKTLQGAAFPADSLFRADSTGVILMKEVVVVATRIPQPFSEISLSTTRMTSHEFLRNTVNDAGSAFGQEAGVAVLSYAGLKGLSTISIWGASSKQVLVTVDGHPTTSPFFGATDLGLLSLNSLQAIEVVKGAGSSLYGANALGGTVDFVSRTPRFYEPGKLGQRVSVAASVPAASDLNYEIGGRLGGLGFQVGLEHDAAEGIRSNNRSESYGISAGAGIYLSDQLTIDLNAENVTRDMGVPGPKPDPDTAPPQYGDRTASSLFDKERDRFTSVRGNLKWSPDWIRGVGLSFELKPGCNLSQTTFRTLSDYALYPTDFESYYYESRTLANSVLGNLSLPERGELVVGYDQSFDRGNVAASAYDTAWQTSGTNHGVWAELIARLPRSVVSNASLRWDFNRDYGRALSPSFGLACPLSPHVKLRANWGTAFRAPTFNDRYYLSAGGRDIKPGHGMTLQAGGDLEIPAITLNLTGFYRRTIDLVVWQPDTGTAWRPTNLDDARHWGGELTAHVTPFRNLDLGLSATYLRGTQIQSEVIRPMAFLPLLGVGGNAAYRLLAGTRIGIAGRYRSERYNYYRRDWTDPVPTVTKRLPPYVVLDADFRQTLPGHLELAVKLGNWLNAKYSEQFGNSVKDLDYPQPGRLLTLLLRYPAE